LYQFFVFYFAFLKLTVFKKTLFFRQPLQTWFYFQLDVSYWRPIFFNSCFPFHPNLFQVLNLKIFIKWTAFFFNKYFKCCLLFRYWSLFFKLYGNGMFEHRFWSIMKTTIKLKINEHGSKRE
jgi:hypothetical protein